MFGYQQNKPQNIWQHAANLNNQVTPTKIEVKVPKVLSFDFDHISLEVPPLPEQFNNWRLEVRNDLQVDWRVLYNHLTGDERCVSIPAFADTVYYFRWVGVHPEFGDEESEETKVRTSLKPPTPQKIGLFSKIINGKKTYLDFEGKEIKKP